MFTFIKTAFPWIILGLAIAFFMSKSQDQETFKNTYMREGFFLGAAFGAMLSFVGIMNFSICIALGAFLGEIFGLYIRKD